MSNEKSALEKNARRVKLVPRERRIKVTSRGERRVDPELVAKILGAERAPKKSATFDDYRKWARALMIVQCPVCRSTECSSTDYSTLEARGSVRRQCGSCGRWYHPEETLAIALMQACKVPDISR